MENHILLPSEKQFRENTMGTRTCTDVAKRPFQLENVGLALPVVPVLVRTTNDKRDNAMINEKKSLSVHRAYKYLL
jgi:hypothetical protein